MSNETYHIPVMLQECIAALAIDPNGTYVDLTMGGGGHTREILSHLSAQGHLYSLDQDPDAESNAPQDERHTFVASNFRFVRGALRHRGVEQVDGILADLGVSSHHFDAKHRGFSFRGDAPLDMRMNTREGRTAADIVNTYTNDALAKIFSEYGELDTTWKIANCIERARAEKPITTTAELVEAVKPCTPPKDEAKFLTKLFQALRIELNGEMEALKMALEQSLKLLKPGGRLVVMSYHSLEDRIVKNFMRSGNTEGVIEKDFFGRATTPFKVITRKAIVPTDEEININPRSRSAKLRVAERIND
jgi:16S rRNA (cytosine1402-N4)-methyltransferase